jgi:hypothetical protein
MEFITIVIDGANDAHSPADAGIMKAQVSLVLNS